MGLNISLMVMKPCEVYDASTTHNNADLAEALGIYHLLWRTPEGTLASELVEPLRQALTRLESDEDFKAYEPANGFGGRVWFTVFVRTLLAACYEHPGATVDSQP